VQVVLHVVQPVAPERLDGEPVTVGATAGPLPLVLADSREQLRAARAASTNSVDTACGSCSP
jgi:hypothetical protein